MRAVWDLDGWKPSYFASTTLTSFPRTMMTLDTGFPAIASRTLGAARADSSNSASEAFLPYKYAVAYLAIDLHAIFHLIHQKEFLFVDEASAVMKPDLQIRGTFVQAAPKVPRRDAEQTVKAEEAGCAIRRRGGASN